MPVVKLFEIYDRRRAHFHSKTLSRHHDHKLAGNRLRRSWTIEVNRADKHHVLHGAKLLAALSQERSARQFERSRSRGNRYRRGAAGGRRRTARGTLSVEIRR